MSHITALSLKSYSFISSYFSSLHSCVFLHSTLNISAWFFHLSYEDTFSHVVCSWESNAIFYGKRGTRIYKNFVSSSIFSPNYFKWFLLRNELDVCHCINVRRNCAQLLIHVNVFFFTAILYTCVYRLLEYTVAWHIFRVVTHSRQWNYLRPERNLSYLEIICAWRAETRRNVYVRIEDRYTYMLRKITCLRVPTLDFSTHVLYHLHHLWVYESWRLGKSDENDCLAGSEIPLDMKLICHWSTSRR